MKKIILSTIISSVLILGVVKYEDILNKASNTIQVQKETKKLSQENKKKALYNRLQSYSKYGFDINQTSPNSYLITVKDSKKSVELFLNIFNLGYSLDSEDKQKLQQVFKDARFDVSVDWDKYISDAPRSVEVNYIGKGDESKPFAKLLMDKKVGAYLTYQGNAELKKIEFKNLNETLSENNESVALLLNDTIIDIKQLPNNKSSKRVYTIQSKEMNIIFSNKHNFTSSIAYKDLNCTIDKFNAYLGKQECKAPTIEMIIDKSSKDEIKTTLNNLAFEYETIAKNNKANEDVSFKIDSISINKNFSINDIKANINIANMDENILKEYMQLIKNQSNNTKQNITKLIKLAGQVYSNNTSMDYSVSIDNIKGNKKGIEFTLKGYTESGKAKFDDNITYDDKATIQYIKLSDVTNKANMFEVDNFRLGYGIYDLFNLLPQAMDILSVISVEQNITKVENIFQTQGMQLAQSVLNQGFGIYIKPLGYDNIKFNDISNKTNFDFGKTDIQLNVKLLKNDLKIDINNPMMPMILLNYLKADGKITIPAKDLQALAKDPTFAILGIFMMIAKLKDDNAIFVIEFKDDKLLINGQPMI